jgi:hypothetical protein
MTVIMLTGTTVREGKDYDFVSQENEHHSGWETNNSILQCLTADESCGKFSRAAKGNRKG